MTAPATRRVAGAGGIELVVSEAGDPAAPTVVLVHGYPDDATMWAPVAARLAGRFHVVAYDTRGSGASGAPRGTAGYRLELLVEDLAAVVDATSPDRPVHLVGHDWGSVQGWEAVTTDRMAGRIAGFTSMSGPCLDHAGWWIRAARTSLRASAVRRLAVQALQSWYIVAFHLPGARLFWRLGGGRIVHRVLVRAGELPPGTAPSPTLARSGANGVRLYRANMLRRIRRPGERRTGVPVQLLVPTGDRFLHPDLLDGVDRWAPRVRRRSVPGRHWLPRLAPDLVADAVAGWVDDVESGRTDEANEGDDDRSARAPGTDRVDGVRALRQPGSRSFWRRSARHREPSAARTDPLRPRRVRFGWEATPLHWVRDPQTTHTINVLHLLLPAGERWFVDLYRGVLPDVTDERLRADVKGFIGQEATHARAHAAVLDHLAAQGLDAAPYTRRVDWLFDRLLSDAPLGRDVHLPGPLARRWTRHRLGIVAAIEHVTAALGGWLLAARAYDGPPGATVDPVMLDMLRWHAAEEVEHRAVAFDLFVDRGGRYPERLVTAAEVLPVLVWLWIAGTVFLLRHDPTRPGRPTVGAYRRAAREGWLPPFGDLARMVPSYLRPRHHPLCEGSTAAAVAYLARSPAARAAAGEGEC